MPDRMGLIAGSGQFPLLFARAARRLGWKVHAAAYVNETTPELNALVDTMEWFHLGQLKKVLNYFHRHSVSQAVMMGAIRKTRMFTDIKPDMKAIMLMAGLGSTHDDTVLKKVAGVFEKEGIRIQPSTLLLPELLAVPGTWTQRKPSRSEKQDMALGWRILKHIGMLDLGQCVVIGGGTVLAVEAIEGTDDAIRRGGNLGNGHAVVVKACKPTQDLRFDMPAIGLGTIESMNAGNVQAMAVLADKTVVFDKNTMIDRANSYGMALVCLNETDFDRL